MNRQPKFEVSVTGLVFSLFLIALFAGSFAFLLTGLETEYNMTSNSSLARYNKSQELISYTNSLRQNTTNVTQEKGFLDVVGAYFGIGYSSLKLSVQSIDTFNSMMDDAAEDVEYFAYFKPIFVGLIIVLLVLLLISALLKWKV